MKTVLILIMIQVLYLSACKDKDARIVGKKLNNDQIMVINRELVIKDRERIENYIRRKGLDMTMTPSGLWYAIDEEGSGEQVKDGTAVVYDYECELLDGTLVYSSKDAGPASVKIGRSDIASGLDEGLRLVRKGSKATFIMPGYLGFGLMGDGNKIPSRAVIVYKINVFANE